MMQHTDEKQHDQIRQTVEAPLMSTGPARPREVDPESGLVPPPWWDGDEKASTSSAVARNQSPTGVQRVRGEVSREPAD